LEADPDGGSIMRGAGLFAALIGLLVGQSAAANPLLSQVTEIWQSGATELAGVTLPAPAPSNNSVIFDCGQCETPFVALLQEDTLPESFGTSDPDTVIAQMQDCGDVDCTVTEFTYQGRRAVQLSYTVLETKAATARYFRDSGKDLLLVVLREVDETDDFPVLRAFEDSYVRPILAGGEE